MSEGRRWGRREKKEGARDNGGGSVVGVPERPAAAVGRWGACARGGPAVGAQGAGLVSGMGCLGGPQGDLNLGKGPGLSVRRDPEAFPDCLGWGSESDARV